ncbi:MAG: hypothetical protein NUV46_00995 [Nanoarchaeota archaeon]|nr:hypothetical protein [Nanoarchaeota archaeon]
MSKKGEIKLSFGMIFSIILIIVFLGFAFFAIQKFLGLQKEVTTQKFYESLQSDVNSVWSSTEASTRVEYIVPGDIKQVCFKGSSSENVYFYTDRPKPGKHIEHLDLPEDSFCFPVSKGKAKFTLEKNYGENLVRVKE